MKYFMMAFVALLMSMSSASAQINKGGFVGPSVHDRATISVAEAIKLRDDARVVLEGKIVKDLGDEKYLFQDATGEIIVEIDDEDFNGRTITPENVIEIKGEVDKGLIEPIEIDVDSFVIKK